MGTPKVKYLTAAFALCLNLSPVSFWGQSQPPSALKLTKITFTGLQQYSQALAVSSSGLQAGQTVKLSELDSALDRLMKSGLFKTAHYRYSYTANQAEIFFDVEEEKWNIPVVFDNFIWFSDDELIEAVRKRFPFFQGPAPDTAGPLEVIKDQLQQFLQAHGRSQPVEYISQMDLYGRNRITIFTVDVNLPVCEVHFAGADQKRIPELEKAAAHFIGEPYSRSAMDYFARSELVSIYQTHGYLKATFAPCQARPSPGGTCQGVLADLTATEGAEYRWHGAVWSGNQALSAQQLNDLLGMKEGEVANVQKVIQGQKTIDTGYGRQGYLAAQIRPRQELQDDTHLVTYHFTVTEGPQYRMGKLIVKGLSDPEADRVKSKWKLAEGAVIDVDYVSDFAAKNLRPRDIGFVAKNCETSFKFDKQRSVADVVITIQKQ